MSDSSVPIVITLEDGQTLGALLLSPAGATHCFVFAHGAGAGMSHSFMQAFAEGLAKRDIASLRFQFPFTERGSRRPDKPATAHAAIRAAVAEAQRQLPECRLIAGGKSFGGRMTSQAQAAIELPGVVGLAFVGFPLHPAGKPAIDRADHLQQVGLPMLFLQGTRDELATLDLLRGVIDQRSPTATLSIIDDADHSFHVRASSGRNDAQAMAQMLDSFVRWVADINGASASGR